MKYAVLIHYNDITDAAKMAVKSMLEQTVTDFTLFELDYSGKNLHLVKNLSNGTNHKYYSLNFDCRWRALKFLLDEAFNDHDFVFNIVLNGIYVPNRLEYQLTESKSDLYLPTLCLSKPYWNQHTFTEILDNLSENQCSKLFYQTLNTLNSPNVKDYRERTALISFEYNKIHCSSYTNIDSIIVFNEEKEQIDDDKVIQLTSNRYNINNYLQTVLENKLLILSIADHILLPNKTIVSASEYFDRLTSRDNTKPFLHSNKLFKLKNCSLDTEKIRLIKLFLLLTNYKMSTILTILLPWLREESFKSLEWHTDKNPLVVTGHTLIDVKFKNNYLNELLNLKPVRINKFLKNQSSNITFIRSLFSKKLETHHFISVSVSDKLPLDYYRKAVESCGRDNIFLVFGSDCYNSFFNRLHNSFYTKDVNDFMHTQKHILSDSYSSYLYAKIAGGPKIYPKGSNPYDSQLSNNDIPLKVTKSNFIYIPEQDPYNYEIDALNNKTLSKIYKNIDNMVQLLKNYKNILFICADYPNYGGAATNCEELANFFAARGHITYSLYYNYTRDTNKKYNESDNSKIIDQRNLSKELSELSFQPDIIIVKSTVEIEKIRQLFSCEILFFIPGIFKNTLNQNYKSLETVEQLDKYINHAVLKQIKTVDFSFCNSDHTKKLLKTYYHLDTGLFYSSFVQFYSQKLRLTKNRLSDSEDRKYKYGIIASDFDRKIKNIEQSIELLRFKQDVILIGRGSHKYRREGFTCIDTVPSKEMNQYYRQIKYIQQDSHYESCSNVKIESTFNYCSTPKKILFACCDVPNIGGAATNTYELLKMVKSNSSDYLAVGLFISNLTQPADPENIGNVYHVKFDSNLSHSMNKFKNEIGQIDLIFCKSYKVFVAVKKTFPAVKIIYSPSGIRYIGLKIDEKYLKELEITNTFWHELYRYQLKDRTDTYDYIVENDKYLEKYVLSNADYVLCNSQLTHDILSTNSLIIKRKLLPPIYLSNLKLTDSTHESQMPQINLRNPDNFTKRKYDIAFVATSWKRNYKNVEMVKKIVKSERLTGMKIAIVGSDIGGIKGKHIYLKKSMTREAMNKFYPTVKTVVIPSKYDSNPNVLVEAVNFDCNVVSSENTGNTRYLDSDMIVADYTDHNKWIDKILLSVQRPSPYSGPTSSKIRTQILDQFDSIFNKRPLTGPIKKHRSSSSLKIGVLSTQVPYNGGASSLAYDMHNYFLSNNLNSIVCFFLKKSEMVGATVKLNPKNYKHVFTLPINFYQINKIIGKIKELDLVIAVNYGIIPLIHKWYKGKIIYQIVGSPELTLGPHAPINSNESLNKFLEVHRKQKIRNNDNQLSLEKADYVLTNSQLTKDLYNYIYPEYSHKLNYTGSVEYEVYSDKFELQEHVSYDTEDREYDIVAIASNWNRMVKNVSGIYQIFSKLPGLKKLIIGKINKKVKFDKLENTTVLDYVPNTEVHKYLSRSKLLLVLSYFESASITILEALQNGCKVLTTTNVGLYKLLPAESVCQDIYDEELIISKINTLLTVNELTYNLAEQKSNIINLLENHEYLPKPCIVEKKKALPVVIKKKQVIIEKKKSPETTESPSEAFTETNTATESVPTEAPPQSESKAVEITKRALGIYKVPAIWDTYKLDNYVPATNLEYEIAENLESFNEHQSRKTSVTDNIYLNLYSAILEKRGVDRGNYIFVDTTIKANKLYKWKNVDVWLLHSIEDVLFFSDCSVYFLRGKYLNFYDTLTPADSFIVFYPATSLKYVHNSKHQIRYKNLVKRYNIKSHPFYSKINIALIHEDKNYERIYSNSKLVQFEKYASDRFTYLGKERINDFIFVADPTQQTKNHDLLFSFIDFCESNKIAKSFIYVAKKELVRKNVHNFNLNYKYVTLKFKPNQTPSQLNELFNQTKINLTLSGRDACPRTISESLAAGCYNIALDTLSDGKFYFYEKLFGNLFSNMHQNVEVRSGSLAYCASNFLWKTILKRTNNRFDHGEIAKRSRDLYNQDNILSKLFET